MPFQPIGSLLGKSLKKAGISQQVNLALALERASEGLAMMLGGDICDYLRPVYIQRRTLNIASINAAAASSVGMIQEELIAYVNKDLAYPVVERIRIIS